MSSKKAKRRQGPDQVIVMDLGRKSTKALHVHRRPDGLHLVALTVEEAPIYDKDLSPELLAEHLKAVHAALGGRVKHVEFVVGVSDSIVRRVELPTMPIDNMRTVVRLNSKNYLQQELTDHNFDCQIISSGDAAEGAKPSAKQDVFVGGARQKLLQDISAAAKVSGLVAGGVQPGSVAPYNAFELTNPKAFSEHVVALLDIGFKSSAVTIVHAGDLALSRVINTGSDQFTQGLVQALGVDQPAAETLKHSLADEAKPHLQMLVRPLARELRTSIDFFENQHDQPVSEVFVSGATARNPFILETLQEELMLPCLQWNPLRAMISDLPPERAAMLDDVGAEFVVAAGAAAAALN